MCVYGVLVIHWQLGRVQLVLGCELVSFSHLILLQLETVNRLDDSLVIVNQRDAEQGLHAQSSFSSNVDLILFLYRYLYVVKGLQSGKFLDDVVPVLAFP